MNKDTHSSSVGLLFNRYSNQTVCGGGKCNKKKREREEQKTINTFGEKKNRNTAARKQPNHQLNYSGRLPLPVV